MKPLYLSIIAIIGIIVVIMSIPPSYSLGSIPVAIPAITSAPLRLFKEGIPVADIICKEGFQLVIKTEDGSPACIDDTAIPKLVLRGWMSTNQLQNKTFSGDFYPGIENESGTALIENRSYYLMTPSQIQAGDTVRFHNVVFSFPYGWFVTPGGGLLPLTMTFPDGVTETYGNTMKNSQSTSFSGLSLGPGPSSNRTVTILSSHAGPQAGVTLTEDSVKLLVSTNLNSSHISTQTSNSSYLMLNLSTSSQVIPQGQPIDITISVNNTLSKPLALGDENSWKLNYLRANPCTTEPYGLAIVGGFYSEQNVTTARPLPIFNDVALCPAYNKTTGGYVFEPSSGRVTLDNCTDTPSACSSGFDMGDRLSFSGTWKYGQVQPFNPGLYTVVGGDEWGHLAIRHFAVSNSTIFAGNLGSMSCPARYGGVQFGADVKNSTGFTNYWNSTQYGSSVFVLHPGMQGTISVQYSSPANAAWFQNNGNGPYNMTDGAAIFYMANATEARSVVSYAASIYNDNTGRHTQICHYGTTFSGGFAEPCDTDNRGDIPPSELPYASKLLHVGIDTSFEPGSVMLYPDSNPVFTARVSASPDASTGVYWLVLGRDLCGPAVLAKLVVLP